MDNRLLPLDRTALFLALDATLADIAPAFDAAEAEPGRLTVVRRLGEHLCGRVAVLSGHGIEDVDAITECGVTCVASVHGLERRSIDGEVHGFESHPAIVLAADALESLAESLRGLRVERKGRSVAIHYRQAPAAETVVLEAAGRLVQSTGLEVLRGRGVVELRTPTASKGFALRSYMLEAPFFGATPLVLGDDLTDEEAFHEAAGFGGFGVLVGEPRESRAAFRLTTPSTAHAWLADALASRSFDLGAAAWLG